MAFLSPSPLELVVILVIALMVLGPQRLPDAARSIGRGMREFRNSFQSDDDDDDFDEDPEQLERARAEDEALEREPAPPGSTS
jgi:sec-independent protein translocase protein TatA